MCLFAHAHVMIGRFPSGEEFVSIKNGSSDVYIFHFKYLEPLKATSGLLTALGPLLAVRPPMYFQIITAPFDQPEAPVANPVPRRTAGSL